MAQSSIINNSICIKKIGEIADELKFIHGDHYGQQLYTLATEIMETCSSSSKIDKFQLFIEMVQQSISDDYKNDVITSLKKKVKELENQIALLFEDNRQLREENRQIREQNRQLREENKQMKEELKTVKNNLSILMKKHYTFILWQAYKNLEYYIIKSATGYNTSQMETLKNTNLTEFIKVEAHKQYLEAIFKLIEKFNIESYRHSLGKLGRHRNGEAHPDPIEMEELASACNAMKDKYIGIEELYNHYQEVYDYLEI